MTTVDTARIDSLELAVSSLATLVFEEARDERGRFTSGGGGGNFDEKAFNQHQELGNAIRAVGEKHGATPGGSGDMTNPRVVANANVSLAASHASMAAGSAAMGDHASAAGHLMRASRTLGEAEQQARTGNKMAYGSREVPAEAHAHAEAIHQVRDRVDSMIQSHLTALGSKE